jgi:hypothetical protein
MEYALVRVNADQAGLTIASYLRAAGVKLQPPPAGRCPSINQQMTSRLIAVMGEATTAFRDAAHLVDPDLAATTMNSINEYRIVLFKSMGRAP